MSPSSSLTLFLGALSLAMAGSAALAQDPQAGAIVAPAGNGVTAPFDITHAGISTQGNVAVFHMGVSGAAGTSKPAPTGQLAGADVFSYVWPTTLDTTVVGFEPAAGILALAVTAHPDFDDTPLYDENGDGKRDNDGNLWHSHWVVLTPDDACGTGALTVKDIAQGETPRLPKTWPGLPILLDSPGWSPVISVDGITVQVPFDAIATIEAATFDGVTAGLRVNESVQAPLLCVNDVLDVASGDLSLPGKVSR